jgi:DNA ligase 1
MKFSVLAQYFEKIDKTSSRLEITQILSDLFTKLDPREFDKAIYLMQGRVAPLYEAIEFGLGEKMVARAAATSMNLERKFFDAEYKKIGDLGETVEYFRKQHNSFDEKDLSISEVFDELHSLATRSGDGSQESKMGKLGYLIRQLDSLSVRYLVRIPLGVLRLGFSDMTVLDSYSWMLDGTKSHRPAIEKAYHVRPDLGNLGKLLKVDGLKALKKISPTLFTPILMMRAERLSSAEEIVKKIGMCAVESKYDGFRLQVHYKKVNGKGQVRLYSRNLEDVTPMYPDIVEGVKKELTATEAIIEGEAIGYDPYTRTFLPFQLTSSRKRKYGIEEKAKEIPLKLFTFELLYLNGENLISTEFRTRRKKLMSIIDHNNDAHNNTVIVSAEKLTDDAHEMEILFDTAISDGLEGIVAKKLDGVYQPGARGWNWIKFKRSYSSKIEDSVDCLVMGYDFGKGKRTGFGIGAFLVGVYDEKADQFVSVSKIGTGLTDDEWRHLKDIVEKYKTKTKPALYDVDRAMGVDVWVKPSAVVEIKADEITRSAVHTAGRIMKKTSTGNAMEVDEPGYALRFPRLVRFREDRKPEDATSLHELKQMFKSQKT